MFKITDYDDLLWAVDITGTVLPNLNGIGTSMVKLLGCIGLVEEESERIIWVIVCSDVNFDISSDLSGDSFIKLNFNKYIKIV